jgi:hypothetical protein
MNLNTPTDEERALAVRVLCELLHRTARPHQLKSEYSSVHSLHFYLALREGFRIVKNEDYGGGALEQWPAEWTKAKADPNKPVRAGRMLLWRRGRIVVRVKTHGESSKPNATKPTFRAGSPHLSVCLVSGQIEAGLVKVDYKSEVGKFDPSGRLLPKALDNSARKCEQETWSDNTHFSFPDLWCSDDGAELLGR